MICKPHVDVMAVCVCVLLHLYVSGKGEVSTENERTSMLDVFINETRSWKMN